VFTREDGFPIDLHTPTHLFSKITKRVGLRHNRLHDLRHLHTTELLRLGEPLHVVAQRLGHRDAMVTATVYATSQINRQKRLAVSLLTQLMELTRKGVSKVLAKHKKLNK